MIMARPFVDDPSIQFLDAINDFFNSYQQMDDLPLEHAIKNVIPDVPNLVEHVRQAKSKCLHDSILTWDESTAIYLYSMTTRFSEKLNKVLRNENRESLQPWLPFMKLFITALKKLPSSNMVVWRGISINIGAKFTNNKLKTWWSVISCSKALEVAQRFLNDTDNGEGTVLAIRSINAKDISAYTVIRDKEELILMPGTRLRVKSEPLSFVDRLSIVYLEEESDCTQQTSEITWTNIFEIIGSKICKTKWGSQDGTRHSGDRWYVVLKQEKSNRPIIGPKEKKTYAYAFVHDRNENVQQRELYARSPSWNENLRQIYPTINAWVQEHSGVNPNLS